MLHLESWVQLQEVKRPVRFDVQILHCGRPDVPHCTRQPARAVLELSDGVRGRGGYGAFFDDLVIRRIDERNKGKETDFGKEKREPEDRQKNGG